MCVNEIMTTNLDHSYLMDIFQEAVGEGFTNDGLEKELKKGRKPATTESVRKRSFSLYRRSVQSVRTGIEEQGDVFKKSDLEALLNDFREIVALVDDRLPETLDNGGPAAEAPKKNRISRSGCSYRRSGDRGGQEEAGDQTVLPGGAGRRCRMGGCRLPERILIPTKFLTNGKASDRGAPTLGSGNGLGREGHRSSW